MNITDTISLSGRVSLPMEILTRKLKDLPLKYTTYINISTPRNTYPIQYYTIRVPIPLIRPINDLPHSYLISTPPA